MTVTAPALMLDLQWTQLSHDERYHKDVVLLPLGERVKHMALHMAKYVGYLAEIDGDDPDRVSRILVDAFIITLATANTLNQDLGRDLAAPNGSGLDLSKIGHDLAAELATTNDVSGLLRTFARHAGALAKACESLDHMESFPFRNAMRESNLALFKLVVAAAAVRSLDLAALYAARLRVVEERSIFDARLRDVAPVAAQ
ncbi:hypothetical protein HCU64_19535 [Methylobacterium sp. C25]|uniref:hypothetical protein n=1 Tax=Methylobacterium sp. C25 TaxID=2721622 RepID=UPI001F41ACC5|nr:hypothetical protein [Methylobacterium sp. C25]MCE4225948.1 hypothetical protein [Methylobacterium sp. C25]